MLVARKGIKTNRGLIAISVATIFLFTGIAAGYVQEDRTKIYGALQEGKTVTITYRREGEGRRIIRFIALTITVKE